jgi:hypothetical protein
MRKSRLSKSIQDKLVEHFVGSDGPLCGEFGWRKFQDGVLLFSATAEDYYGKIGSGIARSF